MPVAFARTLRSLDQDRAPRVLWLLLLVIGAWAAWMLTARISVYETTRQARIEVTRAAFPVASLVDGRIVSAELNLGEQVQAGRMLVQLDATTAELARAESLATVSALQLRRAAIDREAAAERATLEAIRQARETGITEVQAQITRVQVQLKLAQDEAQRLRPLFEHRAVSESEVQKAESRVAELAASLAEARATLERTQLDRRTAHSECNTRIVRLEREAVDLDGAMQIERAAIDRHAREIEDRTIVAPVSGRLDEVSPLRTGSVVTAAQQLAVVVPPGEPQVVARFPVIVVGRIHKGQPARLRLDGFPWTQFGTVPASVTEVGTEPIDGLIRVEFTLRPDATSRVPIEHGLTGSVEVEVEQSSPALLVLRAAGQFLGIRHVPTPAEAGA